MSRRSDMEKMVRREAKTHGFLVEKVGPEWRVTNPATKLSQSVPDRAVGSQLTNARARIRQLATRGPMQAAVVDSLQDRRAGDEWPVQELVTAAFRSGVSFDVVNGHLRIAADLDNQSWVDVLRRRESEVLAFLLGKVIGHQELPAAEPVLETAALPATPQGADDCMPKIGDVARFEGSSRKEDLAADARALYDLLREEAAKQGDETETNARVRGVLWRGTLTSVLRSVGADWDLVYQEEVSRYLRDTQHIRCQRRGNPSLWWIRDAWHDGNLTVTRQPTPADVAARKTPASPPPPAPAPASDEYAQLMKLLETGRTAAATIDRLQAENAGLRREVKEKNAMFLSVRSELRADVEALRAENRRLKEELAKLEPFKHFIRAVKETDL
ncbi:hypothetical protein ABZ815_20410 [Nonomuraea sp. NPDC047529]|uniref:hypothetical protein n=1 Tax=Nonomuraea sp. NPDC047529 TaxID=3155623 RepID=UPI0033DB066A